MTAIAENPNLKRRRGPGVLTLLAPLLKPLLRLLRKNRVSSPTPLIAFQSYLVGDLFMALPALKILGQEIEILVLCRPDCIELLRAEGLEGIPFDNAFFIRPGFTSFFRTLRAAWKLRGQTGIWALDFDADPRTAFWLKIAGVRNICSYSRPYAVLFDALFHIPASAIHQADKNLAVASGFLIEHRPHTVDFNAARQRLPSLIRWNTAPLPSPGTWLISCWTRKDTKNWPLERWDDLLERMLQALIPFQILEPPDGDAAFRKFQSRWCGRVEFVKGPLLHIAAGIRVSAGVLATDNFTGHMAGYYDKPVLWINGSSDPRHVLPRGPGTLCVQVDPMTCRPCGHHCVNPEYKACLQRLTVNEVWEAFGKLRAGVSGGQG